MGDSGQESEVTRQPEKHNLEINFLLLYWVPVIIVTEQGGDGELVT